MLCTHRKYIKMCKQEVVVVVVGEAEYRLQTQRKGHTYLGNQCLLYILSVFLQQTFRKLGCKLDTKLELFLVHR
jgi:hypothetical protein